MSRVRSLAFVASSAIIVTAGLAFTAVAGAQATPPAEVGCTVFDPAGDTADLGTSNARAEDRADITQLCVDYGYSLRVVVVVATPTNPSTDPGWGESGDSRVEVGFDVDADPDIDLIATADGDEELVVRDAGNAQARCAAGFYVIPTGYAIEVSRNCLGTDSVATSVRMVYDPAPAPTSGPLVADTAPDTGFVPRVTRAAPGVPQPLTDAPAAVCTPDEENDTVDENFEPVAFDPADIVESCVQHGASELRLTMRMRQPTDPQVEPVWRVGSGAAWDIDANNDLNEDFTAIFTDSGVRLYASDASDASDFCEGTPGFDGTLLIAHFPRACLGTPGFVAVRPFAFFARVAQVEPDPPAAIDLFRFPGFGVLVGAPGVEVPPQAPPPPSGGGSVPPATSQPTGVTVVTGGGTGQGVLTAQTGTATGAPPVVVTQASSRRSGLAVTGAPALPIGWGLALTVGGGLLVMASRKRREVAVIMRGQWDLLPATGERRV